MSELFSITALAPVIRQSADSFHERLQTQQETFTLLANKGFSTANFVLTGEIDYLTDWFADGLIRDITIKGPEGQTCWNGFVSQLSLSDGGSVQVKSIESMANRVITVYRSLNTNSNPPQTNEQSTVTVNDTDSQDRYGVKVIVDSGGEATTAEATSRANSILNELSQAPVTESVQTPGSQPPSLAVQMRGYSQMADWYTYTNIGSGTVSGDTLVKAILAADPNGVLSTDDTDIDSNPTQFAKDFDGKERGWKIIEEKISGSGDSSVGQVWVAGIYEGRRTIFKIREWVDTNGNPLSSNKYLELERNRNDAGDLYIDQAGREVKPWDLRPDRILTITGRPRTPMYINSVTFNAPYTVRVQGIDLMNPMGGVVRL